MSGHDRDPANRTPRIVTTARGARGADAPGAMQVYGTIVVVGGGCYGAYYVRQLRRARDAGVLRWTRLLVVDANAECRVAQELPSGDVEIVTEQWSDFFAAYLDAAAGAPDGAATDAIVPSPLMPHLLFDWLVARIRARYPSRAVEVRPLGLAPRVPWQRASPGGETHYVSFAEWICPINCIEPQRCPKTRGERTWTMPAALREHVAAERTAGHDLDGPLVFHCVHRAYGVGMIDVRDVISAERALAAVADDRAAAFLVGTVSHCHGALGVLAVAR